MSDQEFCRYCGSDTRLGHRADCPAPELAELRARIEAIEDDDFVPAGDIRETIRASVQGEVGEIVGPPIVGTDDTVNAGPAKASGAEPA